MKKQNQLTGRFEAVHGKEGTTEYVSWRSMMARCYNPNHKHFRHYGGKGVTVCDRWHEAANFLADMGEKPSVKHSIGRIDNDKGYSPDNCRWETITQQNRNRSNTKITLSQAREIRMLFARGYLQRELATEFKVTKDMISLIVNHKRWREDE